MTLHEQGRALPVVAIEASGTALPASGQPHKERTKQEVPGDDPVDDAAERGAHPQSQSAIGVLTVTTSENL